MKSIGDSLSCQAVQLGSFHLVAAKTTQVPVALVITDDHHDVGRPLPCAGAAGREKGHEKGKQDGSDQGRS